MISKALVLSFCVRGLEVRVAPGRRWADAEDFGLCGIQTGGRTTDGGRRTVGGGQQGGDGFAVMGRRGLDQRRLPQLEPRGPFEFDLLPRLAMAGSSSRW